MANTFDDELLSVRQVAELVGRKEKTIRAWISRGLLPATKPGGKNLVIRRGDIVALVKDTGVNVGDEQVAARTLASMSGRVVISP